MPPKKKGNKRGEEDWEAELGESAPAPDAPAEEPQNDGEEEAEAGAGGLMAALRKNKAKKAKKGKPTNDFVEGEDAGADIASKQPEEGTFDEDDVFAGKAAKKPIKDVPAPKAADKDEDGEFRVKSKKEKEREKKEREKARKKEQVRLECLHSMLSYRLGRN